MLEVGDYLAQSSQTPIDPKPMHPKNSNVGRVRHFMSGV